ncbi:helix-turn-helix domain-containing protein [Streptomyces sp. BI20]|uniref:helix-turn-helix domain-containing protein n=1 Tax=Streptomyces sp. BI20 TaxID=3403460 RepID=UPI003C77E16E
MPPRTAPTYRQVRLGTEIRRMRTAAGMTAETAARLLGVDRGKISNIESGTRAINEDRLRTLALNCACEDTAYVDGLVDMARPSPRGWWEEYRGKLPPGMLDITELEWHAISLASTQTVHLPGLLQTEEYSRLIFGAVLPPLPRLEIELRTAHRQERTQVINGDRPKPYLAYIHEAALRMLFGGRATTREQLTHLIEQGEREHISVRVITVEHGMFPGTGSTLLYADAAVPNLATAQLDSAHGPGFLDAPAQLAKYRSHLAWLDKTALSDSESRQFIHSIIQEL